jgi:hypothetical protein
MQDATEVRRPAIGYRYPAALGLFLLAPLIGEFLLGNLPITFLPALVALAPLYGGGALVIREVARRAGLGWPGMLMLCLAFGVIEEGFVTQSLFNPDYLGLGLGAYVPVPGLGVGLWWTVFVLGLHAVWSTAVPIALVETLVPAHRTTPWLGPIGIGISALLFAVGCGMTIMFEQSSFTAAPHQFALAAVAVAGLVAGAFLWPRRSAAVGPNAAAPAPRPLTVGMAGFAAGSLFVVAAYTSDIPTAWVNTAIMLLLLAGGAFTLLRWSRRAGWDQRHRFAVAAGLTLTYVWFGFLQVPSIGAVDPAIDLIGNAVFSAGGLAILAWAAAVLQGEAVGQASWQA